MCLEIIKSSKTEQVVGYGWKVFKQTAKKLYPVYYPIAGKPWATNKFLKATRAKITINTNWPIKSYKAGFHIFISKRAALRKASENKLWLSPGDSKKVVRLVKYRIVVARGRQWDSDVIVAKEMKIFPANTKMPIARGDKKERPVKANECEI